MTDGLARYKAGDFNSSHQEELPDGIKIITLSKRGEDVTYRFKVRDLYGAEETVLEDEIIER